MRTFLPLAFLALVALAFGRSLVNDFTYDDHAYLVENTAVHTGVSPLDALLDAQTHTSGDSALTYRPLRTWLFSLEHRLFGLNPLPYRVLNLLLHAGVAFTLWRLGRRLLPERRALLAAFLFAVHPLASEVVVSIKAQDDLVAAFMLALAAWLFLDRVFERNTPSLWIALSFLYAVGMLAKENAVILPAVLAGLWFVTRDKAHPRARLPWKGLASLAALGVLFLLLRASRLDAPAPQTWLFPSALAHAPQMLRLFLWPADLTIDYTHLPLVGFGSARLWISIVLQAGLCVFLWRTGWLGARAGVIWVVLTLLPSLNPLGGVLVFAERFAYLPSIGLAWIAITILAELFYKLLPERADLVLHAALVLFVLASIGRAAMRSADWKDDEALFRSALAQRPDSVAMRGNLAGELIRLEREDEARIYLKDVREVQTPTSFTERKTLSQLGVIALRDADWTRGAELFGHIVESPYAAWHDWLNHATALINLGRLEQGRASLEHVLERRPTHAPSLRMLGRIGLESEDYAGADRAFERALASDPKNGPAWYYAIFAAWKARGEEAALARLGQAHEQGIDLSEWITRDEERWALAPQHLRKELGL